LDQDAQAEHRQRRVQVLEVEEDAGDAVRGCGERRVELARVLLDPLEVAQVRLAKHRLELQLPSVSHVEVSAELPAVLRWELRQELLEVLRTFQKGHG
jgi:hypothetical protein